MFYYDCKNINPATTIFVFSSAVKPWQMTPSRLSWQYNCLEEISVILAWWPTFLLSCWAAKLLSCWATELLSYWATHTCRLWRRDQGEGAAAAGTVRAGARGGAGGGRLQGAQWYQGAQELSIFLLSLCLWLLSGAECILNGNFNVTLYGNWSHFTPSQKQRQKQEENKIWITMLRDKQEAFALYCQCRYLDIERGKMRRFFPGSWYETKCLENTGDILSYWYWIGKSIWSGNMNWKLLSNFEILIW